MNPFDVIKDISFDKKGIITQENEKDHNSWMVNKGLSYFADTIEHSNRMNMLHNLPAKLQNDYLINIIRKRKRFSKWFKVEKIEDIELIMDFYNCNRSVAKSYLEILNSDQIKTIKSNYQNE